MIAWLIKLTGLSSIFVWLIIAGIAAAGVFGYGVLQHHNGYEQAKTEYTLQIQTMKLDYSNQLNAALERQSNANAKAKVNEAQKIIEYETKIALRDKIIKDNSDAAKNDPNANNCGVSNSGRLRLNQID